MFYVHALLTTLIAATEYKDDHYLVRRVSHSQTRSLQNFFIAVTRRAQHRQALSFYYKPFLLCVCTPVDYATSYVEAYK